MKKTILTVFTLLLSMASFAQKISADQISGIWQCEDYKIEIFKVENTYSAKLLWSKEMFEADGKTAKKDLKKTPMKSFGPNRCKALPILLDLRIRTANTWMVNFIASRMEICIASKVNCRVLMTLKPVVIKVSH